MKFPKNQFEFHRMFNDESACIQHMIETKWPEGFACPCCSGEKAYWVEDRNAMKCAKCGEWSYLTEGTVMQKSRTPLCTWFLGAYMMTTLTPGISAVQFQRQSGLTRYETAFQILHKLRAAMVAPERRQLSGEIEVDESFVGGEKEGKRGRGAWGKAIVAGAVEVLKGPKGEHAGRIRLQSIIDASEDSLMEFIETQVEEGSTIVTDGWKGYLNVPKYGFDHEVVEGVDSSEVAKELVHVHRVFGNLKTWLNGTHHGVSAKHLPAYLNEFVFRYNRRKNPWLAFDTMLGLLSEAESPTYAGLYAAGAQGGWEHPGKAQALV
jgi:transposase-like protein